MHPMGGSVVGCGRGVDGAAQILSHGGARAGARALPLLPVLHNLSTRNQKSGKPESIDFWLFFRLFRQKQLGLLLSESRRYFEHKNNSKYGLCPEV